MDSLFPDPLDGKKKCQQCGEFKPLTSFHKNRRCPDGLYVWCKACKKAYGHTYNRTNYDYDKGRERHLLKTYGITLADYWELFAKQRGVCAVCGNEERAFSSKKNGFMLLTVDHDHATGRVRSLLCSACNSAYGLLNEDPERIRLLLNYSLGHPQE